MAKHLFTPHHLNATPHDLSGNHGIGRYILLPGSDGRAQEIAKHFNNVTVKSHPRAHNLYLGTITCQGEKIAVATVASGMGCPSMEIILHELFHLGAKRFLRIGTAGSLQSAVKVGDFVNVQASVRDENTTVHYAPLEVPAIASLEYTSAVLLAAEKLDFIERLHTGVVHCKSSLYAREFSAGPRHKENDAYIELLTNCGVLATEMETAALFIQSQLYNHQLSLQGKAHHRVLAGAIMAIIATVEQFDQPEKKVNATIQDSISLAIEAVKTLAIQELDD
ncbi:MAG: hypothetical protein A3E83_01950 [Gammaproteobacteria bacterium RIFCSPHIGHO2_12_FULL_41_20]|nr:MAG: hypothetical protein A3E83_01950 [Gammaproteobacteria bacterium RIFCSPHIGHO2_12_FULL_41_20]